MTKLGIKGRTTCSLQHDDSEHLHLHTNIGKNQQQISANFLSTDPDGDCRLPRRSASPSQHLHSSSGTRGIHLSQHVTTRRSCHPAARLRRFQNLSSSTNISIYHLHFLLGRDTNSACRNVRAPSHRPLMSFAHIISSVPSPQNARRLPATRLPPIANRRGRPLLRRQIHRIARRRRQFLS
jgi:hypothetical protein